MNNDIETREIYRYERKFLISDLTLEEVEILVKRNPGIFVTSYPERYINNIYFDTYNTRDFFDNIDGIAERKKIRIRWYGEMYTSENPAFLEIKKKQGFICRKFSYPLKFFHFRENITKEEIFNTVEEANLPQIIKETVKTLQVSIINSYRRKYFCSLIDKEINLTLDWNLQFFYFFPRTFSLSTDNLTIIEIKYPPEKEQIVQQLTQFFPFRLSKMSKYVFGIEKFFSI